MKDDDLKIGVTGGTKTRDLSAGSPKKAQQGGRKYRSAALLGAKQAMVKITGRKVQNTHAKVQTHLAYLTREDRYGKKEFVTIELSNGERLAPGDAAKTAFAALEEHLGKDGGRGSKNDRKAYPLMLSFPPGTDREKAEEIAREWGARGFGDKAAYAWVMHNDTEHPHAHFLVAARGYDGSKIRINPRDLKALRMLQAEVAGEYGVALTTSTRLERGEKEAPKASRDRGEYERLAREEISPGFKREIEKAYKQLSKMAEPSSWEARRLSEWRNAQALNLDDAHAYRKMAEMTPAKADFYNRFADAHEALGKRKDAPPSLQAQYRDIVERTLEGKHAAPADLSAQRDPLKPTAGMIALIDVIAKEKGLDAPEGFRDNFHAARGFLNDHARRDIKNNER